MKLRGEVSADKLRGGFYSPEGLVRVCLNRIAELTAGRQNLRVLEPSAGDGAFVRGLRHTALHDRVSSVTAVELLPSEADKCKQVIKNQGLDGIVHAESFLTWASQTNDLYDAAAGNPPFLRYQFVDAKDKAPIALIGQQLSISFAGVSNLWIPILLGAIGRLEIGGAFAFIIPAECFTGISASKVRHWLASNVVDLQVDLFPVGSFPAVLQEVVILSGRRVNPSDATQRLKVRQHHLTGRPQDWDHALDIGAPTWTRYLLTPTQLEALSEARMLRAVHPLGELARLEVSIVTGANDYFSVNQEILEQFDLQRWALPLLPRIRHAKGLVYTRDDQGAVEDSVAKAYLLHFAADLPDPRGFKKANRYISQGEEEEIHARYKCHIRTPWYRVPHIWQGRLMLSKRSHRYPRLVLNDAKAFTTDTIYRGRMQLAYQERERDLVAAFHNSLTLLSAEIEGRSFGGGVLELVPSEIRRLLVPLPDRFGAELIRLDQIARASENHEASEALVAETDLLLVKSECGFSTDLMDQLHTARQVLLRRRLDRTSSKYST